MQCSVGNRHCFTSTHTCVIANTLPPLTAFSSLLLRPYHLEANQCRQIEKLWKRKNCTMVAEKYENGVAKSM